jgi:hypothetical protein
MAENDHTDKERIINNKRELIYFFHTKYWTAQIKNQAGNTGIAFLTFQSIHDKYTNMNAPTTYAVGITHQYNVPHFRNQTKSMEMSPSDKPIFVQLQKSFPEFY